MIMTSLVYNISGVIFCWRKCDAKHLAEFETGRKTHTCLSRGISMSGVRESKLLHLYFNHNDFRKKKGIYSMFIYEKTNKHKQTHTCISNMCTWLDTSLLCLMFVSTGFLWCTLILTLLEWTLLYMTSIIIIVPV